MIPQEFIDGLNRDADLVEIIGRHVPLTQKGSSYVGLCPFHGEKTPSFNVVPDKNFYHCFGCGATGSALKFLMSHLHGNDFVAAVEDLAKQMGREVPRTGSAGGDRRVIAARDMLQQAQEYYHQMLMRKAKAARDYLKQRGIAKETALAFGLGYAPKDGGLEAIFGKEIEEDLLVAAGLAKRRDRGRLVPYFRDRVMFPITNTTGQTVGFGGRIIGDGEPKYLNSPQSIVFDKGRIAYGLREATAGAKEEGCIVTVEGYMDVVMLAQNGLRNAVATMGTAATETQLRSIFMRSEKVVFCFDGDSAGRRAAAKALANAMTVLADGKDVGFIFLPQGEDPDSYVQKNGADGVRELLRDAMSLGAMLLRSESGEEIEKLDTASRTKLWRKAAGLINRLDEKKAPFLKEELYKQLADASSIGIDDLKKAAQHVSEYAPRETVPVPSAKQTPSSARKMDDHLVYRLIVCLAVRPDLLKEVQGIPLFCKSRNDIQLCEQIIAALENEVRQKKEGNVVDYLRGLGYSNAARQVKNSADKRRSNKSDIEKDLRLIVGKMKKQAEENVKRQRRSEQMDEKLARKR